MVRVQVLDGIGLVWSVEEYLTLRTKRRLMGTMVGGLPGYRQQDQMRGLPCEFSLEEVTLAVWYGWIELWEVPPPPLHESGRESDVGGVG